MHELNHPKQYMTNTHICKIDIIVNIYYILITYNDSIILSIYFKLYSICQLYRGAPHTINYVDLTWFPKH